MKYELIAIECVRKGVYLNHVIARGSYAECDKILMQLEGRGVYAYMEIVKACDLGE